MWVLGGHFVIFFSDFHFKNLTLRIALMKKLLGPYLRWPLNPAFNNKTLEKNVFYVQIK